MEKVNTYSTEEMAHELGFTKTYVLQVAKKAGILPDSRTHGKGNPSFYWTNKHLAALRLKLGKKIKKEAA